MVRHLLEKWKADPTQPDRMGMNALHTASFWANDNMEIIDLLLEYEKVDINERDEIFGRTALHWAVRECNSIAVGHLIDKGADPNIYDKDGLSPLHLAASKGNGTEIMDFILKAKKAKQNDEGIDDVDHQFGTTALHMAVTASNLLTVEYLIEKGADNINYRHKSGCTPFLLAAAFTRDMKIINLLLKNIEKEDVEQYNTDASSLLGHITANEKRLINRNIVRIGEKDIFDLEECDRLADKLVFGKMESSENEIFDETESWENEIFDEIEDAEQTLPWALIIRSAIEDSDVQRVRKLIETGVDIGQAKWTRDANALHVASPYAKTTELIDVILETGQFDINGVDNDGETPLHYAINGRNPTIARHLIQMGADPKIANYNGITPLESKAMDLIELITNSYRSQGGFCLKYFLKILSF